MCVVKYTPCKKSKNVKLNISITHIVLPRKTLSKLQFWFYNPGSCRWKTWFRGLSAENQVSLSILFCSDVPL